ncbi:MAG: galactokinase [Pyrinomonadaceae bacterium]
MISGKEQEISVEKLSQKFEQLWPTGEPRFFRAPGRVNLIGEHTDYNDGFVLPIALNFAAVVAAASRSDDIIEAYSLNFDELKILDLNKKSLKEKGEWINYVEGIARVLREKGCPIGGASLLIGSNVPVGAGLSSSAALEISVGLALLRIDDCEFDSLHLALAGQAAEHQYVGTKSGIMDQFVSVFGREGHALLIDCRSLEAKAIPLDLKDTEIVVCNSGLKHALASSEYNTRRAECERGVGILKSFLPEISALRDVDSEELVFYKESLPETVFRRCRHIISENQRTLEAAEAFQKGDLDRVGKLMSQSHASLRDDFEVSCPELDLLVSLAENFGGAYGARMTGGGFGGCTISLIRREMREEFDEYLGSSYEQETGIRAEIFHVEPSDGATEIN